MRRNLFYTIVVIALLIGVIGALLFLSKRAEQTPTAGPGDLAAVVAKPKPVTDYFEGCPPSGDGGDPVLNTLKNRIDEGVWASTTISALLALTWPEAIENQPRSKWSATDKEAVALYEGSPVQVEGYLVEAKKMKSRVVQLPLDKVRGLPYLDDGRPQQEPRSVCGNRGRAEGAGPPPGMDHPPPGGDSAQ